MALAATPWAIRYFHSTQVFDLYCPSWTILCDVLAWTNGGRPYSNALYFAPSPGPCRGSMHQRASRSMYRFSEHSAHGGSVDSLAMESPRQCASDAVAGVYNSRGRRRSLRRRRLLLSRGQSDAAMVREASSMVSGSQSSRRGDPHLGIVVRQQNPGGPGY